MECNEGVDKDEVRRKMWNGENAWRRDLGKSRFLGVWQRAMLKEGVGGGGSRA